MDFVVGQPRSGTTFLSDLLNSTDELVSLHENLRTLSCYQIVTAAFQYYEGRRSADSIKRLIKLYDQRPQIRVDVGFVSIWILGPLLEMYPDARFVHLVRNPQQNVRSSFNEHDLYGSLFSTEESRESFIRWCVARSQPWLYVLMEHMLANLPRLLYPDWDKLSSFERNCAFWTEGNRLVLDALASRKDMYLLVRLEDLSRDDGATAARIFEFLDLPVPSRENLKRLVGTRQNTKDDPMWAEIRRIKSLQKMDLLPSEYVDWPRDRQETLRRMCGEMAVRLGYKLDY